MFDGQWAEVDKLGGTGVGGRSMGKWAENRSESVGMMAEAGENRSIPTRLANGHQGSAQAEGKIGPPLIMPGTLFAKKKLLSPEKPPQHNPLSFHLKQSVFLCSCFFRDHVVALSTTLIILLRRRIDVALFNSRRRGHFETGHSLMLSPRPPPVPRLRIACLAQTSRSHPRCGPATVGRCGVRHVTSASGPRAAPTARTVPPRPLGHHHRHPLRQLQLRGKKTTVVKLDELPQGLIVPPETLAPVEQDDEPQYPTVVQQARRNMQKFDNCVLLTRVGGFYELYLEQADEYGPLLNLKVAQKKTSAGPVSMLDRFLKILVQDLNRHVAIAEEFPNDASAKVRSGGLMHDRRVARIVTPGTLIDENFMDPYANNYVMAVHLPEKPVLSDHVSRQAGQQAINTPDPANDAPTPIGLAWLDLSTGYFFTQPATLASLGAVLSRVSPREVVLDNALESAEDQGIASILQEESYLVTYSPQGGLQSLEDWLPMLEGKIPAKEARKFTDVEVDAGSLLLHYVGDRLQGLSMKLQPPARYVNMEVMNMDKNTMRSLEIKETVRDGTFKGSLLYAIRRTVTKSGARLLNQWLSFPSTSLKVINARQDLVERFIQDEDLRDAIIVLLRRSHDSQRLVQKFALNRGDADDLLQLASTIKATEDIVALLEASISSQGKDVKDTSPEDAEEEEEDPLTALLSRISLKQPLKLAHSIRSAIDEENLVQQHQLEDSQAGELLSLAQEIVSSEGTEEDGSLLPKSKLPPPPSTTTTTTTSKPKPKKSASIRDHYSEETELWIMQPRASRLLSTLHTQLLNLKSQKESLTLSLREEFQTPSLTLKWTPQLGHICHVKGRDASFSLPPSSSSSSSSSSPNPTIRTLSTSRSTRSFHHPSWSSLGDSLSQTRLAIRAEESRVFSSLRQSVILNLVKLRRNASVLDELDILTSFASLAVTNSLVRPLLNNSTNSVIVGGRHPTVESGLQEQGRTFTKNDLFLSSSPSPPLSPSTDEENPTPHGRIWLITGPNMAGKSTFLRQNALITILAQIGCYVPADFAELGIVDAIFSRVGSADNLYASQSTFMVEMLETAAILRQATPRSFVIMDEVGRGTTPEDGTAVAFAGLYHLIKINKCRALFATHFHEIADLVTDKKLRVEDGGKDGAVEMYCTDLEEDDNGGFVYVHKLRKGINRQSHALKVARLAGLPEKAIQVAKEVLERNES
ncbi:muts domain V-domain-containing protein [Apiosordaria backusii]|uniref:Muts domain V-domain-containing protein n=1 Tax=Apiosordaria backusii TaxID=314023 RepID=A0AA40B7M6_9PEZI|nr:muts domain V-domain-containing protein [Apiosordaria backusii]